MTDLLSSVGAVYDVGDALNNVGGRLHDLEQTVYSAAIMGKPAGTDTFPNGVYIGTGPSQQHVDLTISPLPSAPTITSSTYFSNVFIDVSWVGPSDNTASWYDVELALKTGSTYSLTEVQKVSGTSTRFKGLISGRTYGIRITPRNVLGLPGTSSPATGFTDIVAATDSSAPSAITGFVMTAGLRSVIMVWDDATDVDMINGQGQYQVQIATDSGMTALILNSFISASVAGKQDLTPGTQYWGRVRAIDSSGNPGPWTATASVTIGQILSSDLLDGAVVATKLAAGSANRLMDSSFEGSNLSRYWTPALPVGGSWTLDSTTHYHGLQSARFSTANMTSGIWGVLSQEIRVTPGETLYIEFLWGQSANTYQSHLKVDYIDSTGAGTGSSWFPLGGTDGVIPGGTVVQANTVVPANAVQANVSCMGGWSSDGNPNSVNFDGIYLTSNPGLAWAPAANEILPAVSFADMIVANAVQLRHMSADSVDATVLKAQSVDSSHINTVGLDAGVVKFGQMSGGRILGNSAVIGILATSTLTTTTVTLGSGGQIAIGSPPTTGLYINDNGIRLYSGGTVQVSLDVGGTASFTGTINATAGTLGSLSVTGTLTGGNINGTVITGSTFQTAATGHRIVIDPGGSNPTAMLFYPSDQGTVGHGVYGWMGLTGGDIYIAGTYYTEGGNVGQIRLFDNRYPGVFNSNVEITGITSHTADVSIGGGLYIVGPPSTAFGNSGWTLQATSGAHRLNDTVEDVSEIVGNAASTVRTLTSDGTGYRDHWAGTHVNMSDPSVKQMVKKVAKREMLDFITKSERPYRFRFKKGHGDSGKAEKFGMSSVNMPKEAQVSGFVRHPDAPESVKGKTPEQNGNPKHRIPVTLVDPQVQITILWGAVQELMDEVNSLRELVH